MTLSGFHTSFNEIEKILKEFSLLKSKGVKILSKEGVSDNFKSSSIKDDYFECYKIGKENFDYDFLLNDESFFQFEYFNDGKVMELRYAFFQNPVDFITYKEFLETYIIPTGVAESVDEAGAEFEVEYSQHLSEQNLHNRYITIRYDVDYKNYKPIIHSISHLHVGHLSNFRIPSDKFISPLRFVLFTIKSAYYSDWKIFAETKEQRLNQILRKSANGEKLLNNKEWCNIEKLDLYLK